MTAFPASLPAERAGRGEPEAARGSALPPPAARCQARPAVRGAPRRRRAAPAALTILIGAPASAPGSAGSGGPCPPPPPPPPAPPSRRRGAGQERERSLPPSRHPRVPHLSHRASHLSHRTVVAPLKRSPALRGGPFIWGSFMTLCKCAKFLIRLARQPQAALAPRSLHAALCFTAQQAALLL